MTAPVCGPMNVTEVGWKFPGSGPWLTRDAGGAAVGTGLLDWEDSPPEPWPVIAGTAVGRGEPAAAGGAGRPAPGCSADKIPGTEAATAITTTTLAADSDARLTFRRCARWLIRSNVPGRGLSGSTSACSQSSTGSRPTGPLASPTGLSQGRLQPGPGVMQVGLDRALGPAQHRRHLLDAEPGVVVQQERAAQP